MQIPEERDMAGEVFYDILVEICTSGDTDGCGPADMWNNQKECLLAVVERSPMLVESDLQWGRLGTFDVDACLLDILALEVSPQGCMAGENLPPVLTPMGQGEQVFVCATFFPITRNEGE